MNFRGRRLAALVMAVLVTFGLTVAAAEPAQATGPIISRSIYLADSSTGVVYLPYAAPREIYLESATYTWTHTLDGKTIASRDIYLESAWYSWRCTLVGTGGSSANYGINYEALCWLDEREYQGGPVIGHVTDPYGGYNLLSFPLNRTVTWESQLNEH